MKNPYVGKPDHQFWRRAPGLDDPAALDPVTATSFQIGRADPVVTMGSCFAQHVGRHLKDSGFNYLVTERAHPIIPDAYQADCGYGVFSARYGNIYTARQLRQLLERAYGLFEPIENVWSGPGGRAIDPFRPQIQDKGFLNAQELALDRTAHFAAVREAIETLTVFVFTLGLTEAWLDARDGAAFPLAPGVAGGAFDPAKVVFRNFTVSETVEDLSWALGFIREKNPEAKFILTVSPVPLNATAVDRHVLVSTVHSKAILRVAAGEVADAVAMTDYFPSYDIVTSPHVRGGYFAADGRSITEGGVRHVMRLFLRHYGAEDDAAAAPSEADLRREQSRRHVLAMEEVMQVLCDEEALDNR